jgi:hypothetical protein
VLSELELRVMSMEREREDMVAAALHSEREKEALKELLEEERDIAESLRGTNHDLSQALYEDDGRYPTALRQGLDDGHVSDGEEYGTSPRLSSAAIIDMRDPSHLSIGDVAASHVPVPSSPSSPPPFKDEASALAAGKTQAEIDAWKKSHHVDDEDEDEDGASQVQVKGQVEEPAPAAPVVSAEAKGRWGKVAAVAPSRLRKRRTSVARMEFIEAGLHEDVVETSYGRTSACASIVDGTDDWMTLADELAGLGALDEMVGAGAGAGAGAGSAKVEAVGAGEGPTSSISSGAVTGHGRRGRRNSHLTFDAAGNVMLDDAGSMMIKQMMEEMKAVEDADGADTDTDNDTDTDTDTDDETDEDTGEGEGDKQKSTSLSSPVTRTRSRHLWGLLRERVLSLSPDDSDDGGDGANSANSANSDLLATVAGNLDKSLSMDADQQRQQAPSPMKAGAGQGAWGGGTSISAVMRPLTRRGSSRGERSSEGGLEREIQLKMLRTENGELRASNSGLLEKNAVMRGEIVVYGEENGELQEHLASIRRDITVMEEDNTSLYEDNGSLREDNDSLRADNGSLREENGSLRAALARGQGGKGGGEGWASLDPTLTSEDLDVDEDVDVDLEGKDVGRTNAGEPSEEFSSLEQAMSKLTAALTRSFPGKGVGEGGGGGRLGANRAEEKGSGRGLEKGEEVLTAEEIAAREAAGRASKRATNFLRREKQHTSRSPPVVGRGAGASGASGVSGSSGPSGPSGSSEARGTWGKTIRTEGYDVRPDTTWLPASPSTPSTPSTSRSMSSVLTVPPSMPSPSTHLHAEAGRKAERETKRRDMDLRRTRAMRHDILKRRGAQATDVRRRRERSTQIVDNIRHVEELAIAHVNRLPGGYPGVAGRTPYSSFAASPASPASPGGGGGGGGVTTAATVPPSRSPMGAPNGPVAKGARVQVGESVTDMSTIDKQPPSSPPFVSTSRSRSSAQSVFSKPDGLARGTWGGHEAHSQGTVRGEQHRGHRGQVSGRSSPLSGQLPSSLEQPLSQPLSPSPSPSPSPWEGLPSSSLPWGEGEQPASQPAPPPQHVFEEDEFDML